MVHVYLLLCASSSSCTVNERFAHLALPVQHGAISGVCTARAKGSHLALQHALCSLYLKIVEVLGRIQQSRHSHQGSSMICIIDRESPPAVQE